MFLEQIGNIGSGTGMTIAKPPRRFPAPWQVVVLPGGYAVEDATGQRLATFYGRADPQSARLAGALTLDEARRMALNFAKLPELINASSRSRAANTTAAGQEA
jgi:hypothetical protein